MTEPLPHMDQPRAADGTFGEKNQSSPEVAITAAAGDGRLAEIDDEINRERESRKASVRRELELSREQLSIIVKRVLPTAATMRIAHLSPWEDEEMFLEPAAIYDADGKELWIHTSDDRENPSMFLNSIVMPTGFIGENTSRVDIRLAEGYIGIRLAEGYIGIRL